MKLDEEQKQIQKLYFPIAGMIVLTCLALFGIGIIVLAICTTEDVSLYNLFYFHGFEIIISLFFVGTAIFCWALYIINVCMKPYTDVLYLVENGYNNSFANKKGNKLICPSEIKEEPEKYYEVYRTHSYVVSIIREYTENSKPFEPKMKESYWLNLYLPNGEEIRELLVLPILYVLTLPGLLCAIMAEDVTPKFVGLLITCLPVYCIIYDFVKKYKNKRR